MAVKKQAKKRDTFALFDTIFKKLIKLSGKAVAAFINGLFDKNYPPSAKIEYINTETVNANLKRRISDVFIRIAGDTYHIEIQSTVDNSIILRIFESGFALGRDEKTFAADGTRAVCFPKTRIIQIQGKVKNPQIIRLIFNDKEHYDYKVEVFNLLEHKVSELEERGLIILLPFCVLKLRKAIEKAETAGERRKLATLLKGELRNVLGAIERCNRNGIIEKQDALEIFERLGQLYNEIYGRYKELAEGEKSMKYWSITAEIKKENSLEIAGNMLSDGVSAELAAKYTRLPLSKVKKLASQVKLEKKAA